MSPSNTPAKAQEQMKVEIVSATRLTEEDFWKRSALGQSLGCVAHDQRIVTRFSFQNRRGLSLVYNESIDAAHDHDVLLFVHDDVWILDYYFVDRLIEAMSDYDVVGLTGNRRRQPGQVVWCAKGATGEFDTEYLSGILGHGAQPLGAATRYGPAPAECELLDGSFLAARKATLRARGVRFDPRFDFHFYDLDFCRSARRLGLKLGTCRLSASHQSVGNYTSEAWDARRADYLRKWGE